MSTVLVTYWLLSLLSVSVKILYFVVGAIYPHRAESVVESQSISHYSLFHSQHFLTVHAKLPIFSCHVAFTANIFEPTVTLFPDDVASSPAFGLKFQLRDSVFTICCRLY